MKLKLLIIPALICGLVLFSGFGSADLLVNEGFEDQKYYSTHYCCKDLLGACWHNADPFRHPDTWNSYMQSRDWVRSTDEVYAGEWAVKLWSQQATNCTYIGGSSCGISNVTIGADLTQTINIVNTSLQLSFWVKTCPESERPVKCTQLWYQTENYGDLPMKGKYYVEFQFVGNGTENLTYYGEASDDWQEIILDLSNSDLNQSANYTILSVELGNTIIDSFDTSQYCVIFDNVNLTYIEPVVVEKTVYDYISDMNTHWTCLYGSNNYTWGTIPISQCPCDDILGDCKSPSTVTVSNYEFRTSKGFADVPYGNIYFSYSWTGSLFTWNDIITGFDGGITCDSTNFPKVILHYDDDSSMDVSDQVVLGGTGMGLYNGRPDWDAKNNRFRFPIYDWENIKDIEANISIYPYNSVFPYVGGCFWIDVFFKDIDTSIIATRQTYINPMTNDYEILTGYNNLFGILAFNGYLNQTSPYNLNYSYWNFGVTTDYKVANTKPYLYDSEGAIKNALQENVYYYMPLNYDLNYNCGTGWCDYSDPPFNWTDTGGFSESMLRSHQVAFSPAEDGDKLKLWIFNNENAWDNRSINTTDEWTIGEEFIIGCVDRCDENYNYIDAILLDNGICTYVIFANDTRCYPPDEPSEWEEEAQSVLEPLANATGEIGAYAEEMWNIFDVSFDPITKLLIAIIVTISMGVGAMIKTKDSPQNHTIGLSAFLGGLLFFTFMLWIPIWVGIILVIVTGFMLVRGIVSVFV